MRKIIVTIDDDGRFVDITTEEVEKETEEIDEVIEEEKTEDVTNYSIYARIWDVKYIERRGKSREYGLMFLHSQQLYANDLLKAKGYVFLNEVYEMLSIPKTEAGEIVGWTYNKENPTGDNFIDFGIFNTDSIQNRDFINGYAKVVILDFNVDGIITDLIWD